MVAKAGGYFVRPLKRYRGVMQGNPLSPTILNVVMDNVIRHWVMVVTPTEVGMGGLGLTIIDLVDYLYSDDALVASTQPEKLQRVFDVLTGLFNRVGLQTNTTRTFGMVCQSCHVPGRMFEEAYVKWTTGKVPNFWERQRRRVECPECGVELASGLLLTQR